MFKPVIFIFIFCLFDVSLGTAEVPLEPDNSKECKVFQKLSETVRMNCKTDSDCFTLEFPDGCNDFTGNLADKPQLEKARDKCRKIWKQSGLTVDCDQPLPHHFICKNKTCQLEML